MAETSLRVIGYGKGNQIVLLRQLLDRYFKGQEYHIAFTGKKNLITVF